MRFFIGALWCEAFESFISERVMLSFLRRLLSNDHGATAIEYTLIASLIAVAAIVAMGSVGTKVNGVLSNVASTMT
jgi:pilus assembly protein Flp/PilA